MADIAAVFHWPETELREMSLKQLRRWQKKAVSRYRPVL